MAGLKSHAAQNRSISLFMVMDYQTLDMEEHIKDLFEQQGPKVSPISKDTGIMCFYPEWLHPKVVYPAAISSCLPALIPAILYIVIWSLRISYCLKMGIF